VLQNCPFFDIIYVNQHLAMFWPMPRNSGGTAAEQRRNSKRITDGSAPKAAPEQRWKQQRTAASDGAAVATPVILWTDDEKEPRRGVTASPCAMRGDVESAWPLAIARRDVRLVRQYQ
jgi:hypothetical protein